MCLPFARVGLKTEIDCNNRFLELENALIESGNDMIEQCDTSSRPADDLRAGRQEIVRRSPRKAILRAGSARGDAVGVGGEEASSTSGFD